MPKVKLTNTFICRVKCKDKEKIRYVDSIDNNLVLEVKNSGVKTFYYKYNCDSKTLYKKIANYPEVNLDDVKDKLPELKSTLEKAKPMQTKGCISLNDFYTNYYLPFIKTSKKSYKADVSYYKTHILPMYKNSPMNEITRADVSKLHIKLIKEKNLAPSSANKLIKYLSHAYNLAMLWEIPYVAVNPTKGIKLLKEDNLVERYLNTQEINRLLFYAKKLPNPLIVHILQFLLLTGARKSEALNTKWDDIDLDNNIYTIPLSKANKVRRIPISSKLKEVIQDIPKLSDIYLFPSLKLKNKPLQKLDYYWYKIRSQANLNEVRIHDLRHTFASTLVNKGVSLYEVQKLLGHSSITVTQRYAHLSNKSLYDAVSCAGGLLEE